MKRKVTFEFMHIFPGNQTADTGRLVGHNLTDHNIDSLLVIHYFDHLISPLTN